MTVLLMRLRIDINPWELIIRPNINQQQKPETDPLT